MNIFKRKQEIRRDTVKLLCIEERVSKDHLLRYIDGAIDFSQLYGYTDANICTQTIQGGPAQTRPVLFEILLIQHLYGKNSLRRIIVEINMNMTCRILVFPQKTNRQLCQSISFSTRTLQIRSYIVLSLAHSRFLKIYSSRLFWQPFLAFPPLLS